MLPKMIETIAQSRAKQGKYNYKNWHGWLIALLAWAIIAYNAINEYRKLEKQSSKQDNAK